MGETMTDTTDTTTPDAPAQDATDAPKPQPPKADTDWKSEAKKWEQRAKENSTAAARLTALEDAQKSEQQRANDRAEAAEKELALTRADALRTRVAITKGVPADLVDRLRGDTEADLSEDADRLLALIQPGKPRGDAAQGPRGGEPVSAGPAEDFARFMHRVQQAG